MKDNAPLSQAGQGTDSLMAIMHEYMAQRVVRETKRGERSTSIHRTLYSNYNLSVFNFIRWN